MTTEGHAALDLMPTDERKLTVEFVDARNSLTRADRDVRSAESSLERAQGVLKHARHRYENARKAFADAFMGKAP